MVTPSQINPRRVEVNLHALWAEIEGMPQTARAWQDLDDDERFEFALEWPDTMSRFHTLIHAAESGQITAEQQERYEQLVHRYEKVLPIIERLGLQTISVPKLTTPHR